MAERFEWLKIRLEYIIPVVTVLVFASILVYFYYLSNITMKAVIIEEEGTSGQQASAGIVNALIYIIPAIIGGFVIAMLFKYRKKFQLRAFFGSAIFFATTFITFFFFGIVIYVLQLKWYGMILINNSLSFISVEGPPIIYYPFVGYLIIPLSILIGLMLSFVISSKRFLIYTKNHALLILGGLMGAFLAVILPTWTVVFMLVGLSLYDIYSVRQGPIREIMELTYGPESAQSGSDKAAVPEPAVQTPAAAAPVPPSPTASKVYTPTAAKTQPTQGPIVTRVIPSTQQQTRSQPPPAAYQAQSQYSDDFGSSEDDLLSNMTYGTANWDLGIGDLVFYSMLGSHTLMFGTRYISEFGLMAPISLFLLTTVGIILGFLITLRLLKRNSMLPGLPMSIGLGLIGFAVGVGILYIL
ncbi:MAG: hypothetical protein JSV49_06270 [Thermoplasmata archaeon]|nr:MAG: hypothetical protein JSV49_06270 [Thermoplasmata archaeon]